MILSLIKPKKIFIRIILIFLLIIIPVYGFGVGFYRWGENKINKDQSKYVRSQAELALKNLEDEVCRIRKVQYEFTTNEDLNRMVFFGKTITEIQKVETINSLRKVLDFIKNSSALIQGVYIHIPDLGKTISVSEGIEPFYDDIDPEEYKLLKEGIQSNSNGFCYWNDRIFLATVYPLNSMSACIISVEISKKALARLMEGIYSGDKDILILFDTLKGNIIYTLSNVPEFNSSDILKSEEYVNINSGYTIMFPGMKNYIYMDFLSKELNLSLKYYTSEDDYLKILKTFKYWFTIFTIFIIIVISLYLLATYRYIQKPLRKLVTAFGSVEEKKLDIHIEHKSDDEFGFLYFQFNKMLESIKNLIDEVYNQKILAQKAQLKQLQSQINVHFLYNSYFMLHRIIRDNDYENAILLSKLIGEYFQYITKNSMDDVMLENEVYHARIYSNIQAMRFVERIKVDFGELPGEYRKLLVPRLILQPVVENAFNHGLKDKVENGLIIISFEKEDRGLTISVADNGDKLDSEDIKKLEENIASQDIIETTGLANVHRRIRYLFGDSSGLFFSQAGIGGLKVSIVIKTAVIDSSSQ